MKKLILSLSILACLNVVAETPPVWQDLPSQLTSQNKNLIQGSSSKSIIKKRSLLLDDGLFKSILNIDAASGTKGSKQALAKKMFKDTNVQINLPLPDGSFVKLNAKPSTVISQKMKEAHPNIQTWNVVGIDDASITGVIDFTSSGFHGMLMMPDGDVIFIDPDKTQSGDVYTSFSKKQNDHAFDRHVDCELHDEHDFSLNPQSFAQSRNFAVKPDAKSLDDAKFPNVSVTGTKTYRLALSGTAEYTANRGGTAAARDSMVTTINRINPIFERDLGINLELIDAPELIFSDASTDPFSNPDNPSSLMIENGEYLSDQGRLGDFDIGHVFSHLSTGGASGVAYVGVSCLDQAFNGSTTIKGVKAAGATTSSNPQGEIFDLVLVAHELGHQLGASHSFNSSVGNNCTGGRSAELAVEPGSGSTIMSYNGLCGADDLPNNPRDDFFHFASITQVINHTRMIPNTNCGTTPATGVAPTADAGSDVNIPANTPFFLAGTASGGTSSWDQIDIGASSLLDVDNGESPIIRHNIPTSAKDRYIPSLPDLFAGTSTKGEIMPTTTRELNFAYVVRDGGLASDKKLINVTDTSAIFSVVSHANDQSIAINTQTEVTWNVANTNAAPINCNNVDIQLIRQNGMKNMLLASTPNDGSQTVTIPNNTPSMSGARMFVACSDNSFFNISAGNISVMGSSTDITEPEITILGVNPMTIVEGTPYADAGATAMDETDGTLMVTTVGSVNHNVVGTYNIEYIATDSSGNRAEATRTVNVISATVIADTTPPVITINGDSFMSIVEGASYSDRGATAFDDVDGAVTVSIIGSVNVNTVGTYVISYRASDAAGNSASASRTVNVVADTSLASNAGGTSSGGGGALSAYLLGLLVFLGLNRRKPVPVRVRK